jgi:hypothetical protein
MRVLAPPLQDSSQSGRVRAEGEAVGVQGLVRGCQVTLACRVAVLSQLGMLS